MDKKKSCIYSQFMILSGIMLCFEISSIVSSCNANRVTASYAGITFVSLMLFMISLLMWRKTRQLSFDKIQWKLLLQNNIWSLSFFVIFVLLRVAQFDTLPRWDSDTYFACVRAGCENFAYTLSSFLQVFRLAGHISYGFAFFWAIGYFLFPNSCTGMYVINLVLASAAFFMTGKILACYAPNAKKSLLAFAAFIIWSQPMNLGLFHLIGLDYGVLVFIVYMVYFHMQKQYVLLCFFAGIFLTTKETGIVCVAGYCLGYILYVSIASEKRGFERVKFALKNKLVLGLICCGMLGTFVSMYFMFIKGSLWGANFGNGWYQVPFNTFSVQRGYIFLKLKTFFILNFSWVWMFLICICGVVLIKKKRYVVMSAVRRHPELLCFVCALWAHIMFGILYITYNNPRYNLCVEYSLAFFGILFLLRVFAERYQKLLAGIFCLLFLLSVGEAYLTIDPITKMVFPVIDTGSAFPMVSAGWKETPSLKSEIAIYNYQYRYLDKAYDQLLQDIKYDGNVDLVLWGPHWSTVDAVCIDGWASRYYWDTEKQERTMNENEHTVPINRIFQEEFEDELYENGLLHEKAVWIFTPHFEDNEVELYSELDEYYHIDETRQEAGGPYGGKVYYYMMQLR